MTRKEKVRKERTPAQIKELKITVVFVSVVVLIIIGLFAFTQIRWNTRFTYADSLNETLFTYKGGEAKLRDITYYIMIEEESVNEVAETYDAKNAKAYWNLYIDNTFVSDEAKQAALDYCVRDVLYAQIAREAGMKLTKEEETEIRKKAMNIVEGLTDKQKELGMTGDDIYKALENNKLADKLVLGFAKDQELTMEEAVLSAYYGINSKFFKTAKTDAEFTLNESIWSEISLGELTIN